MKAFGTLVATSVQQNSQVSFLVLALVLFQLFIYSRCLLLKSDLLICVVSASLASVLVCGGQKSCHCW